MNVMDVNLMKYNKFANLQKYMLICSGLWPDNSNPFVKITLAFLSTVSSCITSLSILNFLIVHINNVMLAANSAALAGAFFSSALKSVALLWYSNDLVYLNTSLWSKFDNQIQESRYRALGLTHLQIIAKLYYTLMGTILLSCTFNYLIGYVRMRHGLYMLMFPSILPFDFLPGGKIYWIMEITEILANFFVFTISTGVDSIFGLYALQLCGEFKILAHKYENLGESEDYKRELKECIERHNVLMTCKNKLERVFGFVIIWVVISTAIIVCMLLFQILRLTLSSFRFGFVIAYIIVKLSQAFAYAYCGQLIVDESAACLDSIYNATWPGCGDKRFMNDVLFILAQRPLQFSAKGLIDLKMDIFSKIINTSVSYFFLLQTLDEESK